MCRTVVTIDTIHAPLGGSRNLLLRQRTIAIVVFGNIPLQVLNSNPRNYLAVIVYRDVVNLIGDIHMPMNSRHYAGAGTAAANIYQHARLPV